MDLPEYVRVWWKFLTMAKLGLKILESKILFLESKLTVEILQDLLALFWDFCSKSDGLTARPSLGDQSWSATNSY